MTITYELDLRNFKAWSGAKDTLERVINEGKCDLLEQILEDTYPDGMTDKNEKEAYAKTVGFADVYGRNGKCTKGVFGTTDTELKGIAIIGSLTAYQNVDTGNAQNLHVNQILKPAANPVETVKEQYKAVPYEGDPIV